MNIFKQLYGDWQWYFLAKKHLKSNPCCVLCGRSNTKRVVHHVKPKHLYPELEYSPDNLVTICEGPEHLYWGHLGDYQAVNYQFENDIAVWRNKIKHRQYMKAPDADYNI